MKVHIDHFQEGFAWWLTDATGLVLDSGYDLDLAEAKRQADVAVEHWRLKGHE